MPGVNSHVFVIAGGSRRQKRRIRGLLGRITAPEPDPELTLIITDIQNSTQLWEELPIQVSYVYLTGACL